MSGIRLTSKLPETPTTIFTVMSALAVQHNAVNLGQGFPDFPMPPELTALVTEAMQAGFNQYAPMAGWMPLREAIAEKIQRLYGNVVDPSTEVTVTPGGSYAISSALSAVLHPGDEVIILQPNYDSYIPNVIVNGGVPVLVDLELPDYSVNWRKVAEAVTTKTRAIILNSPHNPTGTVLSAGDIAQLRAIVKGTPIVIISDEVYEHIVFDNVLHQSMLRFPDLYERSFVCFSFGKMYHCTGWKLGYCVAPPDFTAEFRKVHQFNAFSVNTPAQVALGNYLRDENSYAHLSAFLQRKRDHFMSLMQSTRFSLFHSSGSYFVCGSYHRISDESDKDFCIRLTREAGVTTIPVSAFYRDGQDHHVVRFCFAKKDETLERAVEKLVNFGA